MFSLKEAGDYINTNFVALKFDLDKYDPDNIKALGVGSYPTFYFFDKTGEEIGRMQGAFSSVDAFIKASKKAVMLENSWVYRDKRYLTDKSYATTYYEHLNYNGRRAEAYKLLGERFREQTFEENFTPEMFVYYTTHLTEGVDSPIFRYILENKEKIIKHVGGERYYGLISSYSHLYLSKIIDNMSADKAEELERRVQHLKELKLPISPYYTFINEVKYEVYCTETVDVTSLCSKAQEYIMTANSYSCYNIAEFVLRHSDLKVNRRELIKLFKQAHKLATDVFYKDNLAHRLKYIRRSRSMKTEE